MIFVQPKSPAARFGVLSRLAEAVGKHIGFNLEPYDISAIGDASGRVRWMYRFDDHESRIYRIQNGMQRLIDLEIATPMDLEDTDRKIQKALLELNEIALRR
jgi:hypothetical protein